MQAFLLRYSADGGATFSAPISDNGPGDLNSAPGIILADVGSVSIEASVSGGTEAALSAINLQVNGVASTGVYNLVVQASIDDLETAPAPQRVSVGVGDATLPSDNMSVETWIDASNNTFGVGGAGTNILLDTGSLSPSASPNTYAVNASVPYSITTQIATQFTSSGGTSLSDLDNNELFSATSINTTTGPPVVIGSNTPLTDSASLAGGFLPGGAITFNLYAPSDTTYSSPVYTTTVPVNGDGVYTVNSTGSTNPGGYLPATPGVYEWVASYSGDTNNGEATSGQGNEPELVTPAVPLSTIDGTKFLDATGNGFSADDTPEAGVTINLYQESNGMSGLQTGAGGDVFVAATTTAANGTYAFTDLPPAVYYVQEVVPTGFIQTGGGPFGVPGSTYYTISAGGGKTYSGNKFVDYLIPTCTPTNISFTITNNYWPVTVGSLQSNTQQDDKVTVTFTVPQGGMTDQLTLVSYIAPGPTFSVYTAHQQQIFDEASGYFKPGNTYSLAVLIPNNYYQIDLICGPAINILNPVHVGPDSSNISYQLQSRLLSYDNGGTQPFTDKPIIRGDFATTGFWTTANGNSVLLGLNNVKSFDDPTNLARWLATTFPNLYGPQAGSHSMLNPNGIYFTDAQVAAAYAANFSGGDQQVLSTALSVYATSINFAVNDNSWAGFNVSLTGSGMDTFDVGTAGTAFGVRNNTILTVMQLLIDVNAIIKVGSPVSAGASSAFAKINRAGGV